MINLIPPEGHATVRREYLLRVGATMSLLFGAVIIVLIIALVPTYILLNAQIQALVATTNEKEDTSVALQEAEADILAAKQVLAQLKTTPESVLVSTVITEIQKNVPAHVTLKGFFFSAATTGLLDKVQVQGTALRREDLVRFKNALEATSMFQNAEVPIADLARDSDVPFVITITLTPKT